MRFHKFITHHRVGFLLFILMSAGTTAVFYAARQNSELRIGATSDCMIVNRGDPDNAGCWCSDGGWQFHCGPGGSGEDSQCQRDCDALNQGGGNPQPTPTPAADRACSSDYRTNTWCIGQNDGDIVVVDPYNNIRCFHTQTIGNDGRKLCAGELITTGSNTPTPTPQPSSTPTPTPTPTPTQCDLLTDCSYSYPGCSYSFRPQYPNCRLEQPVYPDDYTCPDSDCPQPTPTPTPTPTPVPVRQHDQRQKPWWQWW